MAATVCSPALKLLPPFRPFTSHTEGVQRQSGCAKQTDDLPLLRPAGSSLALTSLPSNDSSRSVNGASVDNDSVYDDSVNNASVYTASVNSASVSELHSPSTSLSRILSSHTTFAEVTTPIRAIPTTIIPRTNLEQQQSLPIILTRPVSSGTSTADHDSSKEIFSWTCKDALVRTQDWCVAPFSYAPADQ